MLWLSLMRQPFLMHVRNGEKARVPQEVQERHTGDDYAVCERYRKRAVYQRMNQVET